MIDDLPPQPDDRVNSIAVQALFSTMCFNL